MHSNNYKVWFDGLEDDAMIVSGWDMNDALNNFAWEHGYRDYQDLAQCKGWGRE